MICLDWRDPCHWNNGRIEPCRLCGTGTHLLDDTGRPAHKRCVERLLAEPDKERKRP